MENDKQQAFNSTSAHKISRIYTVFMEVTESAVDRVNLDKGINENGVEAFH